jgi:hypothetical protein
LKTLDLQIKKNFTKKCPIGLNPLFFYIVLYSTLKNERNAPMDKEAITYQKVPILRDNCISLSSLSKEMKKEIETQAKMYKENNLRNLVSSNINFFDYTIKDDLLQIRGEFLDSPPSSGELFVFDVQEKKKDVFTVVMVDSRIQQTIYDRLPVN